MSIGSYWTSEQYGLTESEKAAMLNIAQKASILIDTSFLVMDIAENGDWIVIELNDAQDAGYAGNNPFLLWSNIIRIENMEDY